MKQEMIAIRRIKKINKSLSFDKLSKGRNRGRENVNSHYRKGISGDWKNQFPENIKKIFKEEFGDLLIQLGYEKDYSW